MRFDKNIESINTSIQLILESLNKNHYSLTFMIFNYYNKYVFK